VPPPLSDEAVRLTSLTAVSRRRVIINASSNYVRHGVALVVNLFLGAYIIRMLGKVEYSIWPLVSTVTGFIALIPVGIGMGTGRFLAHALARKDLREVEEITTSVFAALLMAAGVYALIVAIFSLYFERIFDIPEGAAGIGPWAMLLAGLGGALRIPFGVFQGGLNAAQQYVAINLREIGLLLLRGTLVVLLFTVSGPSLIWVAAVSLLIECLGSIVTWQIARRVVPWQKIRRSSFSWNTLWKVNSFSAWMLVGSIAGLLYWKTDNIIINKLLDPTLLTGYSIVVSILLQAYSLASLGSNVLIPAATIMHAQKNMHRMARMIYRANRVTVALGVPVIAFLMIFGSSVLVLYLGDAEYAAYGILFPILGSTLILSLTQIAGKTVPQACGKNAINNAMSLLVAVANVGLSLYFVLVREWGLVGVAAGTAVVTGIQQLIFWPWYVARLLDIRWRECFIESMVIPLAHCLPACGLLIALRVLGMGESPGGLIAILAAAALIHGAYTLLWGLYPEDRRAALAVLGKLGHLGRVHA
jgi:O-antigen/teichoic acid export membrane protein